jgi:hypothetical protein
MPTGLGESYMPIVTANPLEKARPGKKSEAPYRLVGEILARSTATTWAEARREWQIDQVYISDQLGTCLCGHWPIREHCVLSNHTNGGEVVVGNCCVMRFLGLASEPIFAGLRRIAKNPDAPLGAAAIKFAQGGGLLTEWEYRFCLDTLGKRLSERQRAKRREINSRLLCRVSRRGGCDAEN